MKKRMRGSHRFSLVCIASGLTWFASSPAFALDDPSVTLDSAVDAADSIPTTDDLGDSAGALVDTVSSTTSPTVDTVSEAASGTAGAITGTTSDAVQSVSGSAGGLTGAAANGTETLGDAAANSGAGTASGTTGAAHHPGGSSARGASLPNSTQGAPSGATHVAATLSATQRAHGRAETMLTGALGEGPCSAHTSQVCRSAGGASPEDSLAEKVAEIIGLLALTGIRLIPWVTAALILTIVGFLALERGRPRGSRTGHAPAA